nr:hypothetical protein [uncultured Tyzzerella sp.]
MKNDTLTLLNIGLIFVVIALFVNQNKNDTLLKKVQNLEEDYENSINNWANVLASVKDKVDLI